jgi:hypothetical protein
MSYGSFDEPNIKESFHEFKLRNDRAANWFNSIMSSHAEIFIQNRITYEFDFHDKRATFIGDIEHILIHGRFTVEQTYEFIQSKTKPNHFKKLNHLLKILKPSNLLALTVLCVVIYVIYSVGMFMRSDTPSSNIAKRMLPDTSGVPVLKWFADDEVTPEPTPEQKESNGFLSLFSREEETPEPTPTPTPEPTPEESKGLFGFFKRGNETPEPTPTPTPMPTPTPTPEESNGMFGFLNRGEKSTPEPKKESSGNSEGFLAQAISGLVGLIMIVIFGALAFMFRGPLVSSTVGFVSTAVDNAINGLDKRM